MKANLWLLALGLCLGLAATPRTDAQSDPVHSMAQAPESACTATADCCPYTDTWVTCSGSNICEAVDASCPAQRGYVRCDGVTTYCPACDSPACVAPPPACTTTWCSTDSTCYNWCMQHEGGPGVCRNNCCICA